MLGIKLSLLWSVFFFLRFIYFILFPFFLNFLFLHNISKIIASNLVSSLTNSLSSPGDPYCPAGLYIFNLSHSSIDEVLITCPLSVEERDGVNAE